MEVSRTTIFTFRLFRILGVAPYALEHHRIYTNEIIGIKLSSLWCLYSVTLLFSYGTLSNMGLYCDAAFPYSIRSHPFVYNCFHAFNCAI